MSEPESDDICLCGHIRDEHSKFTCCQVHGCGCANFELDEGATDDVRYDPDEDSEDE